MPQCRGGGCSITNPMMVEPSGDPDQDLFAPPEPLYLRGSSASPGGGGGGSTAFAGIGLPPPPPPVEVAQRSEARFGDPAHARAVAEEASMEEQLLEALRDRKVSSPLGPTPP